MWQWIRDNVLADQFGFSLLLVPVLFGAIMGAVAYSVLLERKMAGWIQDRYGPNRVGPWGLFQPIADGIKALMKEDIIPRNVDRVLFILSPLMLFVVGFVGFAVIPWGGAFKWPWMDEAAKPILAQVASVDIGLLYVVAVASLGVYGTVLGGWSSNNKYSFLGGMRAAAQSLSYEVPMGMAILVAVLVTGHLRLEDMVLAQSGGAWTAFFHPAAALIIFVTALAETNRTPFDLAECEQELVGGFHTEYSSMKHAMFFLAEYAHMITNSALIVAMFFGGYLIPGWAWLNEDASVWAMIARMGVFAVKVFLLVCLYMVVRWTLPRFRFDQLMRLAWKSLVPITMALVVLQCVIVYIDLPRFWAWVVALAGNVIIVVIAAWASAKSGVPVTGRQQSLMRREAVG
ncbi:MAG: NADH-quinone oxidoreductase subunit NuoH [Phycisphaerae bacterium]|nr:NADH-quinone oxidoreductase subunit NuoH [Phycisphaerae bacterium]